MPLIRQTTVPLSGELPLIDVLPQTVVTFARDLERGNSLAFHQHRRAQLVYASSGVMAVSTRSAAYVIPPQRAVWMPGGIEHQIDARSDIAMRTLYFDPEFDLDVADKLPTEVCVLRVSPLLRELILTAVAEGPHCPPDSAQFRLMNVIIDQLSTSTSSTLALPMPTDPRLLRLAKMLIAQPADNRTLGEWAVEIGTSKRTLGRLFTAQTGMSFREWRQQRRLLRALELLATGASVTDVALELGYENASAFIAMFRRCFGTTPKRYLKGET
jgi:AraC-like DNA-binding protein/quercetin dioxygenase-like cupin family protein